MPRICKETFRGRNLSRTQRGLRHKEIHSVLLPTSEAVSLDVFLLDNSSAVYTNEFMEHELALEERIDAQIDRAVKRLVQAKTMKQMLGHTSSNRQHEPSNKAQTKPASSAKIVKLKP